jgi:hypothetical protein
MVDQRLKKMADMMEQVGWTGKRGGRGGGGGRTADMMEQGAVGATKREQKGGGGGGGPREASASLVQDGKEYRRQQAPNRSPVLPDAGT